MIHTATARLALLGVLVCAVLGHAQDKKPIVFEVVLPASATLEIGGYMTKSSGESRSFETPAVTSGKTYSYTLKATDGGRTVVKDVILKSEGSLRIDLRPDFNAEKPRPMPKDPPAEKEPPLKPGFTKGPATPGFVTYVSEGRLWVFRAGTPALAEFQKNGGLDKHVTRIKGGPKGMTIKSPDAEIIDAFMKAQPK